ncbi:M56 family metallopeptidase [uncultured Dokdonia sp.]|uniref:M56 family metallopeptidase n=1 Tax=uncultured Dokdonia sp. TaxID=575653 RepID=UPI00262C16A8|nr:M56 family metallopeptidase [uncultured Dokdonia sp.]
MLHYILQIIAYQLLFLVVYDIFLKRETFFTWNRCYLLVTPILSFVLPFIKIDAIRETIPLAYTIALPEVLLQTSITDTTVDGGMLEEIILTGSKPISFMTWLVSIWAIGMVLSLGYFIYKVIKIQHLKNQGSLQQIDGLNIITLPNTDTAFSFFNTIYLGANLSEKQKENIMLHETIHIKELHSFDMLFFELLRIICWFNPLVYVYQNKMMLLQEYTADARVVSQRGKQNYYQSLLSQVFKTENVSFINPFFNHSIIKKRIIMLQKTKSSKIAKFKYAFILPLILSMLVYVACSEDNIPKNEVNIADIELAKIKAEVEAIEMISFVDAKPYFERMGTIMSAQEPDDKELSYEILRIINEKVSLYREKTGNKTLNNEGDIPFAVIDQVPVFPNCTGTNEERKKCMSLSVSKHVNKEFNVSLGKTLGLDGTNRIFVSFKIDKNGNVTNIRARAPHPGLEVEAKRVIETLPQMLPGKQNGVPVGVLYSLPITFQIQ